MSNVILFIWLNYGGSAQSLTWHGDREDREREKCHPQGEHCGGAAASSSPAQRQGLAMVQQCCWRFGDPLTPGIQGSQGDGSLCGVRCDKFHKGLM